MVQFIEKLGVLAAAETGTAIQLGWSQFVSNVNSTSASADSTSTTFTPIYSKIVVAGHSQGAGMAALLSKSFSFHRVLLLAGPEDKDYFTKLDAPWIAKPSSTPLERVFGLVHTDDFMAEVKSPWETLGMGQIAQTGWESEILANTSYRQFFASHPDFPCPAIKNCLAHNLPLDANYKAVWDFMLTGNYSYSDNNGIILEATGPTGSISSSSGGTESTGSASSSNSSIDGGDVEFPGSTSSYSTTFCITMIFLLVSSNF